MTKKQTATVKRARKIQKAMKELAQSRIKALKDRKILKQRLTATPD